MPKKNRNVSVPDEYDGVVTAVAREFGSFSEFIRVCLDATVKHTAERGESPKGLDLELALLRAQKEASDRRIHHEKVRRDVADRGIEDLLKEMEERASAGAQDRRLSAEEIASEYGWRATDRQLRRLSRYHGQDYEEVKGLVRPRPKQTNLLAVPAAKTFGKATEAYEERTAPQPTADDVLDAVPEKAGVSP